MKAKEANWRSAELVMAAVFGGIMSYLVAEYYNSQEHIWALVILFMMVLIYAGLRIFNHFRPDE